MEVGQRVICIDDTVKAGKEDFVKGVYGGWVKEGTIYTIRDIINHDDIVTGILLEEIISPPLYIHLIDDMAEPAFRTSRFAIWQQAEAEEEISESIEEELLIGI